MRRNGSAHPSNAWEEFERMFASRQGLELLLASLPAGSTREDALRFHRKVAQLSRRPCSFLDAELGIERR
jgi:hypothetical protein